MFYTQHVFFCLNQKADGKKCCMDGHADEMLAYAKERVDALGLKKSGVRINKAGCLGRCALGPSLVIYPQGVWYRYKTREDIEKIIQEHLCEGKIVQSLLIDPQ